MMVQIDSISDKFFSLTSTGTTKYFPKNFNVILINNNAKIFNKYDDDFVILVNEPFTNIEINSVTYSDPNLFQLALIDVIDNILSTNHQQNTDIQLATGTSDQVTATEIRTHIDDANNPHGITKDSLGIATGWATYVDTNHVSLGTAQSVSADTDTILNNNAGSKIETQKPAHVTTFYDGVTQRIIGRNGDNLDVMLYFKAVPTSNTQWLDIWIDIGGSIGELYRQTFSFPRGTGVERGILYSLPSAYTLNTWEANGGVIYIRTNASLSIYSINYNFDLSHKAI